MHELDSHYLIGYDHTVCQDYTKHGIMKGVTDIPYIIVCDGCSGSVDSDFGARLLARSAELAMDHFANTSIAYVDKHDSVYQQIDIQILYHLKQSLVVLGYNIDIVCATLMLSFIMNGKVYVYVRGDGTVAINFKQDSLMKACTTHDMIRYEKSAPYYLAYELSENAQRNYAREYGSLTRTVTSFRDGIQTDMISTDMKTPLFYFIEESEIEGILLSSDGLESYRPINSSNPSPLTQYLAASKRVVSFKSKVGVFVRRRMNAMELEDKKAGIVHGDDVSCAAIWITDDKEPTVGDVGAV